MQWKFHFSYRGLFAVHDFCRVSQYSCHSICSHSQVEVHLLALSGVSQIINSFAVLSWQKNYLPVPHSKLVNYPWRNKKFQNELSTGFQLPKRDDVFPLERCENFSERNFCERMEQMISPEKKVIVPHTFKSKVPSRNAQEQIVTCVPGVLTARRLYEWPKVKVWKELTPVTSFLLFQNWGQNMLSRLLS